MNFNNKGIMVIPEGYVEEDELQKIENISNKIYDFIDKMVIDCENKGILLDKKAILAAMCAISMAQLTDKFDEKDFQMVENIKDKLFDTQPERSGENIIHDMLGCYLYLLEIYAETLKRRN